MSDPPSPCGVWRLAVRTLGVPHVVTDGGTALVRIEDGGTVTVHLAHHDRVPGMGAWRSAGPGRVVVVCEWFTLRPESGPPGRVSVRAAAELSPDGRTCRARLQWHHIGPDGAPRHGVVNAEADGMRLEP